LYVSYSVTIFVLLFVSDYFWDTDTPGLMKSSYSCACTLYRITWRHCTWLHIAVMWDPLKYCWETTAPLTPGHWSVHIYACVSWNDLMHRTANYVMINPVVGAKMTLTATNYTLLPIIVNCWHSINTDFCININASSWYWDLSFN